VDDVLTVESPSEQPTDDLAVGTEEESTPSPDVVEADIEEDDRKAE
jgi:hypothetical protein